MGFISAAFHLFFLPFISFDSVVRGIMRQFLQIARGMATFKTAPSLAAEQIRTRDSPHLITQCEPSSSSLKMGCENCVGAEEAAPPFPGHLVDVLRLPSKWPVPRLGTLRSWLGDVRYALGRATGRHSYPSVAPAVLASERLGAGLRRSLDEAGLGGPVRAKVEKELRVQAAANVADMAAGISTFVIRSVAYVLLKVFRCFLSGILVSEEQIARLRRCESESAGVPIIYLPLHRSHLDYILLTYILWHHDLRVPHVASGDNLNFSCFGWLLRGLGAFFIRRRLDSAAPEGKRDFVYRATLHAYMEQLLKEGQPIEFFMEGTRSRLGKTLMPKAGLLSIIVETLLDGGLDDAILVPVSYSYERVLDQGFVEELLGREKRKESLTGVWASMWRAFGQRYGFVRVDFGQPTSLRKLSDSLQELIKTDSVEALTMPGNGLPSCLSSSSLSNITSGPSRPSMYGVPSTGLLSPGSSEAGRRLLVHAVAHHTLYEATANAAVTATQLVALLLEAKYKDGAWLQQLVVDFAWLSGEARLRGASLLGGLGSGASPLDEESTSYGLPGASGCDERRAAEAVREAIALLGPEIVTTETDWASASELAPSDWAERVETDSGIGSAADDVEALAGRLFVKPLDSALAGCLLSYYKNGAMHVFALDGVLATSFLSFPGRTTVPYALVLERAEELGRLLGSQFLFTKPCERLADVLEARLEERFTGPRVRLLQRRRGSFERPRAASFGDGLWNAASEMSRPLGPWASEEALAPIWELGPEEEPEEEGEEDVLRISEFDELYSIRVLRFFQSIMTCYIDKIDPNHRPEWLSSDPV